MPESKIKPYNTKNGVLGLIDVLNASNLNDERLKHLYTLLSDSSVTVGAGLDAKATRHKNRSANSFLLGDGLIIAQNSGEPGSQSSVVRGVVATSKVLFDNDFPHRAVLLKGSYICSPGNRGPAIIFGRAVIDAVNEEKKSKVVGICVHDSMNSTWPHMNPLDLGSLGRPLWSKKFAGRYFLSSEEHKKQWKTFCLKHCNEHPYSAAAMVLSHNDLNWRDKF